MILEAEILTQIRLSQLINPHFENVWKTTRPYRILRGGRGSFKSSTVSIKLVFGLLREAGMNHKANVIVIRENATYLRDSVYAQISWAISMMGASSEFKFNTSPLKIIHIRTGNTFYFYGADKPEKLKSNIVGNVIALWYEEAGNFRSAEVFNQSNPTFIRQKSPFVDQVPIYYTYNPPKNPYSWINEWVDSLLDNDNYFVDTSTYLDDQLGFTTDQQLNLINQYKDNDLEYYRWLYLGEQIGLGTNVYNIKLFKPINELFADDPVKWIGFSTDAGHQQSATTTGAYGITPKGKVILLATYYYSPAGQTYKKAPSELSIEINKFIKRVIATYPNIDVIQRTIDSAEGALRNQYYKDFGIRWHPVKKMKEADMIDPVQDLLAQGRFYYLNTPENQIFIAEHKQYQWDEKSINSDNPKVVKENDHTVDQFKYFVVDNQRFLKLKV